MSKDETNRLAQYIVDDCQQGEPFSELIGLYLENISGCELLSASELEHLIIEIENTAHKLIQQKQNGDL